MRLFCTFGLAAFLIGCGATTPSPPRYENPTVAARRSGEALKEQPLSREVSMTLPRGWKRISPSVLTNGVLEARIEIMIGKSAKPVLLELQQFCRMLTVDGWHCQDGTVADDGSEGSFPYDTARRCGWIAVRHYDDGTAIILKGEWSPQKDRKARKDFETIFLTIEPQ